MQNQQKLYITKPQAADPKNVMEEDSTSEKESQYELPSQKSKNNLGSKNDSSSKSKKNSKLNKFHWTFKENVRYKKFLQKSQNLLCSDFYSRRFCRINVLMSRFVRTRTSNQCRSHHQKMMQMHHSVQAIISFIEIQQVLLQQPKLQQMPISEQLPQETHERQMNIEMNEVLMMEDSISNYFQSNVWWDGSEI